MYVGGGCLSPHFCGWISGIYTYWKWLPKGTMHIYFSSLRKQFCFRNANIRCRCQEEECDEKSRLEKYIHTFIRIASTHGDMRRENLCIFLPSSSHPIQNRHSAWQRSDASKARLSKAFPRNDFISPSQWQREFRPMLLIHVLLYTLHTQSKAKQRQSIYRVCGYCECK